VALPVTMASDLSSADDLEYAAEFAFASGGDDDDGGGGHDLADDPVGGQRRSSAAAVQVSS
jgi:hypothetical protein